MSESTGSPEDAGRIEALIEEFLARIRRGENPSVESYAERHPDLADRIREVFPILLEVESAAGKLAPDVVGPYRVRRELGRGGMGVVYLAEDTRLGRAVALKVLSPEHASLETLKKRFEREAALASQLDHPGICTVYEAGEVEGSAYIAMRYVEGESLDRWVAASRGADSKSPELTDSVGDVHSREGVLRVVEIIEKAARALHVAHEAGLIHRDIKPGNIIVDREGEPVLLDFGLAREEETAGPELTISGTILGTPLYMSPEQIKVHELRVDRRTDVYSLGATLYECLTLRPPFEAPTRHGLLQKILEAPPEDPRRLNPALSGELRVVLETALEKDRDRRYQTALDFAEDLRRVRERKPIHARPAGPWLRLRRWTQRRPALAASLAGLFLTLVVGLATTAWYLAEVSGLLEQSREQTKEIGRQRDAKDEALEEAKALTKRVAAERDAKEEMVVRLRASGLVSAAKETAKDEPTLSLLLAMEAGRLEPSEKTTTQLRDSVWNCRERLVLKGEGYGHVTFSPRGGRFLACFKETVRVCDLQGKQLAELSGHDTGNLPAIGSGSTDYVLTTSLKDQKARLWTLDGGLVATYPHASVKTLIGAIHVETKRVLTGSDDEFARLWNFDGELLAVMRHADKLESVAFTPSGDRILTASEGVWLWDAAGKTRVSLLENVEKPKGTSIYRYRARFAPGGEAVLLGGVGRHAILTHCIRQCTIVDLAGAVQTTWGAFDYYMPTFSPSGEFLLIHRSGGTFVQHRNGEAHPGPRTRGGRAAAFSPDGEWVAYAEGNGVQVRLVSGGQVLETRPGRRRRVISVAFSPDQSHLIASDRESVQLWAIQGCEVAVVPNVRAGLGLFVLVPDLGKHRVYSDDGRSLITLGGGCTRILDSEGILLAEVGQRVPAFAGFLPGGEILTFTDKDRAPGLWDSRGRRLATFALGAKICGAEASPVAPAVVFGCTDGSARLFDLKGARLATMSHGNKDELVVQVTYAPTGDRIASVGVVRSDRMGSKTRSGSAHLWDGSGKHISNLGPNGQIGHVQFSSDGRSIVTLGFDRIARLWDRDGKPVAELPGPLAAFPPRGKALIAWGPDGLHFLDGRGKVVRSINEGANLVRFSPSGDRVLTAAARSGLPTLRAVDGTTLATLSEHASGIKLVRFSPDGRCILTVGNNGVLRLWAEDGTLLSRMDRDLERVNWAEFSPDGRRFVTFGSGMHIWCVEREDLLELAETRCLRRLTQGERLRYPELLGAEDK